MNRQSNLTMEVTRQLSEMERQLWDAVGSRERYERHLAADVVHVLPGLGSIERERALDEVEHSLAWDSYTIDEPTVLELGDHCAALTYSTTAQRRGQPDYRAAVTSVYRRTPDGDWQLLLHQQTPVG